MTTEQMINAHGVRLLGGVKVEGTPMIWLYAIKGYDDYGEDQSLAISYAADEALRMRAAGHRRVVCVGGNEAEPLRSWPVWAYIDD